MKKLGTAPSYGWFCAWLMDQGESKNDWIYVTSASRLYEYMDVDLHVVVGYPSGFAQPHGWEWASTLMKARSIKEKREV
jgi:hypothetical protein